MALALGGQRGQRVADRAEQFAGFDWQDEVVGSALLDGPDGLADVAVIREDDQRAAAAQAQQVVALNRLGAGQ